MRKFVAVTFGLGAVIFLLSMSPGTAHAQRATTQAQAGSGCGNACEAYWSDWMDEIHYWCGVGEVGAQGCARTSVYDCWEWWGCAVVMIERADGTPVEYASFCGGKRRTDPTSAAESGVGSPEPSAMTPGALGREKNGIGNL